MIRALLVLILVCAGSLGLRSALLSLVPIEGNEASQTTQLDQPVPDEVLVPMASILVAAQPIEVGEIIQETDLEVTRIPVASLSPGFVEETGFDDTEQVIGRVASRRFFPGEPINREYLRDWLDEGLSARLLPGLRAFSLPMDSEAVAGGLIRPGDRVDVIYTYFPTASETAVSMTIAMDVRLLALDGETDRDSQNPTPEDERSSATHATLELSLDQIERIAAAEQDGQLRLALRSNSDPINQVVARNPVIRVNRGGTVSLEIR